MINTHRQWLYSKEFPKGKIFEEGEEVAAGWFDTPTKIGKAAPKKKAAKKKKAK